MVFLNLCMALLLPTMNLPTESGWRDLPPIVNEAIVHKFTYWSNQVQIGMRYGKELYTLVHTYPVEDRLKACSVACEYVAQGIGVCITASKSAYSVWLSLRSLSAATQTAQPTDSLEHSNSPGQPSVSVS
jgi:hypothetical protein